MNLVLTTAQEAQYVLSWSCRNNKGKPLEKNREGERYRNKRTGQSTIIDVINAFLKGALSKSGSVSRGLLTFDL